MNRFPNLFVSTKFTIGHPYWEILLVSEKQLATRDVIYYQCTKPAGTRKAPHYTAYEIRCIDTHVLVKTLSTYIIYSHRFPHIGYDSSLQNTRHSYNVHEAMTTPYRIDNQQVKVDNRYGILTTLTSSIASLAAVSLGSSFGSSPPPGMVHSFGVFLLLTINT